MSPLRVAIPAAALVVATACAGGAPPTSGSRAPTAATSTSSSSLPTTAPAAPLVTASASAAIGQVTCTRSVGTLPGGTVLTSVDVAAHPGFDRVSFAFAHVTGGPDGGASFTISPGSPPFTADPSGASLGVSGRSFLMIRFEGGYGYDPVNNPPQAAYTGLHDLKPGLAAVVEVVERGDFEGVLSWIVGLQTKACWHAFALAAPPRLVIDVPTP